MDKLLSHWGRSPPSPQTTSFGSTDSGYESSRGIQPDPHSSKNADQEYETGFFQCVRCPMSFNFANKLRLHSIIHESPFACAVCAKEFACQGDLVRHEEVHQGEEKLVCGGEFKQSGQWGCGRRFARVDALDEHLVSEAGRTCVKPLLKKEATERQRCQEDSNSEVPRVLEQISAFPGNRSSLFTLHAPIIAQYPALANVDWSALPTEDDGYDGGPSELSSFSDINIEYWSDMEAGCAVTQSSIKKEIFEEPTASPSKDPATITIFESNCIAKISANSMPKDSTEDNSGSPATLRVEETDPSVRENLVSSSSSVGCLNNETYIQSRDLSDSTESSTEIIEKVAEEAEALAREPKPSNENRHTESLPRDEISSEHDYLPAASTTESDFEDYETSEAEFTSSEASSESSFVSPVLEAYKNEAVENLMTEFKTLLDHSLRVRTCATSAGSSNSPTPPCPPTGQQSQQGAGGKIKRKERDDDDYGSSRDDENNERYKKARVEDPSQDSAPRRFACPYYRRNSQKHKKHRSCAGPGWISVHRVKEHVLRQHCLPIHCHRCCTIFKTESDLAVHQRLPEVCEVKVVELSEGCSKEQEKLIRKRKRGSGSEEDRWKEMFQCLFPDDNEVIIPTPYYDDDPVTCWESRRDDEFAQYEQYLVQELPRVVRRRLEQVVSESTRPFESELRSQLVDIVRDAQSALFRSYRQINMPRGSSAPPRQEESETCQAQTDSFNFQNPPAILDFSPFFAPPPVTSSYSYPVGDEDFASFLGDPAGNYQPMSDSGYGSNDVSFDGSGGGGGDESGTNVEYSKCFQSEVAPPPTPQMTYRDLDQWFQ